MTLDLPTLAVSDRVSKTMHIQGGKRVTLAELDGAGCIRHVFLVLDHPGQTPHSSRQAIIRIYFDHEPVPYVEAPAGDFFGVMHGEGYYDINSMYLSVKAWNGYNCCFPMPFACHARVEIEAGPNGTAAYLQVDWHRYPDQTMPEPRRFCARWRREMPTRRYGEDYLILDADGPGQLLGFAYGVRLIDSIDRWSHGGADNIYLDGQGEHPAYIRGIGGEDCFGCGYGGNLHPPDSHLYEGIPFYTHDDQGLARPAPRVAAYRFFVPDAVCFRESIQFRFGCMENDICSTVYWYQQRPVRPFYELVSFDQLQPGSALPAGTHDLPLPDAGAWRVAAPVAQPEAQPDAWVRQAAQHGFIDFNHVSRPAKRGVGVHHSGAWGLARCTLTVPTAMAATVRLAWDDELVLTVNDEQPMALGRHAAFRAATVDVPLRPGTNTLAVALANTTGNNHGGWAFACCCRTPAGALLLPQCPGGTTGAE